MIYFYLYVTNFVVVLAETSQKLTQRLTRIARILVDKTRTKAFEIDPLFELLVDEKPTDTVLSRVRHRKPSHCSYCNRPAHTRPTCQKYRAMRWEESRLNSWLKKYQNRTQPADMSI